jgi:chromosome partitioning protein
MKVMTTTSAKGGVGKTTTTVNLAHYFAYRGLKVAVIDLDPLGAASLVLGLHACGVSTSQFLASADAPMHEIAAAIRDPDLAGICLVSSFEDHALDDMASSLTLDEAGENLSANIANLARQGFDVCLIDTCPTVSTLMMAALYVSNYVLMPFEPDAMSIVGINRMKSIVKSIQEVNPGLKSLGLLPVKFDRRNPDQVEEMKKATAENGDVLPTPIGLRSSIPKALKDGVPVWKIRRTTAREAAREIKAFGNYVFDLMELQA